MCKILVYLFVYKFDVDFYLSVCGMDGPISILLIHLKVSFFAVVLAWCLALAMFG